MKHAIINITPQWLITMCKGGADSRALRIVANPLPDDAEFVAASYDVRTNLISLLVESATFKDIAPNCRRPILPPTEFEVIYPCEVEVLT